MKKRNKPVIPGFGLSMGITISILSLVVLIPLASLVVYTAKLSFKDFIETITRARVLASFYTSFVCAFAACPWPGIPGKNIQAEGVWRFLLDACMRCQIFLWDTTVT